MQQSLSELILQAIGSGSRNEFCRRAGISAGNLSRILRGQRPRPEVLAKIAAAGYGASYEQLMQAARYLEKEGQEQSPGIPIYGSIAAGSPVEAFEMCIRDSPFGCVRFFRRAPQSADDGL